MTGATLVGMRITTAGGSTYLVGPSSRVNYVRVARVSGHAVLGTAGPETFAEDFLTVELVSDGAALRMLCTHESGSRFRTSPVLQVEHESLMADPM